MSKTDNDKFQHDPTLNLNLLCQTKLKICKSVISESQNLSKVDSNQAKIDAELDLFNINNDLIKKELTGGNKPRNNSLHVTKNGFVTSKVDQQKHLKFIYENDDDSLKNAH